MSMACVHPALGTSYFVHYSKFKGQIKTHHDIAHLHPQQMPLPNINFLHLMVSEIWPEQDFIRQGHYGKVKDQIKVTP